MLGLELNHFSKNEPLKDIDKLDHYPNTTKHNKKQTTCLKFWDLLCLFVFLFVFTDKVFKT